MEWWQAVILGLVEGLTEYLPVSSTGHLILAQHLVGLSDPSVKSSVDAFIIVVQAGAILAVLGLYWPRVVQMLRGLIGRDPAGRRLLINLFIAFLPAAVLGVRLDDWIEATLFYPAPVLAALALGGVLMLVVDAWHARHAAEEFDLDQLTPRQALAIGLLQCVAMWPGTSRSMMTIAGGMLVGLRPRQAAEFSFLLGLPTLGGATAYKLAKNLKHAADTGTPNMFEQLGMSVTLLGIAVAAISAAAAVRWLVAFLGRHGLKVFGFYRLVLCIVLGTMIYGGWLRISPETTAGELARRPAGETQAASP